MQHLLLFSFNITIYLISLHLTNPLTTININILVN